MLTDSQRDSTIKQLFDSLEFKDEPRGLYDPLRYMSQIGVDYRDMEQQGIISPVLEVSCTYKSMVHFGDIVEIIPKIEKYNGIILELSYLIQDQKTREVRTCGKSRHCFLNRENKPISLKKSCPTFHAAFQLAMEAEQR